MTYINRVKTLASTLKSMGVEIDDQEIAMTVLCGLPARFDHLISALCSQDTSLTGVYCHGQMVG